jgi:hypothetical protein
MLTALCVWREARGVAYPGKLGVVWVLRNRCAMAPAQGFKPDMAGNILKPWAFSSFNSNVAIASADICYAISGVTTNVVSEAADNTASNGTGQPSASSHNAFCMSHRGTTSPPIFRFSFDPLPNGIGRFDVLALICLIPPPLPIDW